MTLTRKEFLSSVVTGAAGAVLLVACGGGDDGDDGTQSCIMNGTSVDIGGNHGHVMTVSKAEVTAGAARTYDISGSGGHTHMVTVSPTLFAMLQGNSTVTTVSTAGDSDGHTHSITVTCV